MFKDRTTATISVVAVIAIVVMVVALITAPGTRTVVAPTQAVSNTAGGSPDPTAAALATQAAGADVQTTASGLKYRVIAEGSGAKPTISSTVTVNYRGVLPDGTEFDSSYSRNQPATFSVGGVIDGWTEGLQLMSVGSKYVFTIPPELAYGAQGSGPVPPNATLIFEVELLSIQ